MIGIMADSHDNLPAIKKAVDFFNEEKVQMVIHAGDLISPFTANEFKNLKMPFEAVFGNNDGERTGLKHAYSGLCLLEDFKEFNINGRKIAVIHGHQDKITLALASCGHYDVLIRAHTHESHVSSRGFEDKYEQKNPNNLIIDENEPKTIILNPGEVCGYLTGHQTVVIMDPDNLKFYLIELT
jgi:putative phosphoesterase